MKTKDASKAQKVDRASYSQYVLIGIAVAIVLVVLTVWRPWTARPVNGVPQSATVTASP